MEWTEEEKRKFVLRGHIRMTRRLYFEKGKSPEEIAAISGRPVALIEKWIENFKAIDQKK